MMMMISKWSRQKTNCSATHEGQGADDRRISLGAFLELLKGHCRGKGRDVGRSVAAKVVR